MSKPFRFEDYEVSPETGFAVEVTDPLPEYYKPWHDLADRTVSLMATQTMREETLKLPQLDAAGLKSFKELRLAHLQLAIITAGYVWEQGPQNPAKSLPACVAVPLCEISDRLGTLAGITYMDIMVNWQRVDQSKPLTRDNIKARYMFMGGQQFVFFQTLAAFQEFSFVEVFPAIKDILEGAKLGDSAKVTAGLRGLTQWVKGTITLSKEFHKIEAETFFREIIYMLRGFNESSGMPDGMLYEGVADRPKRKLLNAAASQSTFFQIIDTLLRVEYPPEKQEFFKTVRTTWVAPHRELLQVLGSWPGNVREMAMKGSDSELREAYDKLVETVQQFRSYHYQLVTKFMLIPNKRLRNELNLPDPDPFSPTMTLLKDVRNTIAQFKLQT